MKAILYIILIYSFFSCGPTPMQRHELYTGSVAQNPLKSADQDLCSCTFIDDPVCGDDGITYDNPCIAKCKGINFTKGKCIIP